MIRIGFDLDGCLDKSALAVMARTLMEAGVEVHVITGIFSEAGEWQSEGSKRLKLIQLGIAFRSDWEGATPGKHEAVLHCLRAVDQTFPLDYRLRDLGLRKGALCDRLGISVFFDDSALYCDLIPRMAGDVVVLQVR